MARRQLVSRVAFGGHDLGVEDIEGTKVTREGGYFHTLCYVDISSKGPLWPTHCLARGPLRADIEGAIRS